MNKSQIRLFKTFNKSSVNLKPSSLTLIYNTFGTIIIILDRCYGDITEHIKIYRV